MPSLHSWLSSDFLQEQQVFSAFLYSAIHIANSTQNSYALTELFMKVYLVQASHWHMENLSSSDVCF